MPLQWSLAHIPISAGLGQGVDERVRPAGGKGATLDQAINCRFERDGALVKRHGFTPLTSLTSQGGGEPWNAIRSIFSTGPELCLIGRRRLWGFSPTWGRWVDRGPVAPGVGHARSVFRDQSKYPVCDLAIGDSGWIVMAAQREELVDASSGGGERYSIHAVIMGPGDEVVAPRTLLGQQSAGGESLHSPRATAFGDVLAIYWAEDFASPTELRARVWDPDDLDSDPETNAVQVRFATMFPLSGVRNYDVDAITAGTYDDDAVLAFVLFGSLDIVVSHETEAAGVLASAGTMTITDHDYDAVAVAYRNTGDDVYVVGSSSTSGVVVVHQVALTGGAPTLSASQTVDATSAGGALGISVDPTGTLVAVTWTAADPSGATVETRSAILAAAGLAISITPDPVVRVAPQSQPWWYDGRAFVNTYSTSGVISDGSASVAGLHTGRYENEVLQNPFTAFAVLDLYGSGELDTSVTPWLTTPTLVGVHGVGVAYLVGQGPSASHAYARDDVARIAGTYTVQQIFESGVDNYAWQTSMLLEIDYAAPIQAAPLQEGAALIGGSVVSYYDGERCYEHSYLYPPHVYDAAFVQTLIGNTPLLDGEVLSYLLTWEVQDAAGVLHRSLPSAPFQTTFADGGVPNDSHEMDAHSLGATNRTDQRFAAVWYRDRDGEGVWYRLTEMGATIPTDYASGQTTTYTDRGHPTIEPIYTTGGILEAVIPEGAQLAFVAGGRAWLGGFWSRSRIQYSHRFAPFTASETAVAPEFNEGLGVPLRGGRKVTGMSEVDDKLVVFTAEEIFTIVGRGPDRTGAANDLSDAQLVSSDVGCIEPRSVVAYPDGVLFQAPAGIYLLDRSLGTQFIGAAVQDLVEQYPEITSATLMPELTSVMFTCRDPTEVASVPAIVVVYDYDARAWTHWVISDSRGDAIDLVGGCRHRGVFYVADGDGTVRYLDDTTWMDDGTYIPMAVETSWLQAAGQGGWQRVRKAGALLARKDGHALFMHVFHDFETSPDLVRTWPGDVIDDMPAPAVREQVVVRVRRQKCQAIKVLVFDGEDDATTDGRGFTIAGFTLELGAKRGYTKLDSDQREGEIIPT